MFIKLTLYGSGNRFAVRADLIENFVDCSFGYTLVKIEGKCHEVRESVDEILAQLAGDPK